MDNITKGFVIAACSVVIAVGGVWLDGRYKYSKALQTRPVPDHPLAGCRV